MASRFKGSRVDSSEFGGCWCQRTLPYLHLPFPSIGRAGYIVGAHLFPCDTEALFNGMRLATSQM